MLSASFHRARSRVFEWIDEVEHKNVGREVHAFQGPLECENEQLSITTGEDVAFCHSINRVKGTTARGKIEMRWRATVCFRKIAGRWLVTHEHNSVPFDMSTGQASLDLKM